MKKVRIFLPVVLTLVLLIAGCAKAPDAEKAAAKTAMDAALSAGADKYASADFEAAKKAWDTAESQLQDKKYKEAKQGYMDAKAGFEKAAAGVEAGKKAVADQANASLTAVEEDWKNLQAAAGKVQAKMAADKKEAWATDSKAIGEGLAKVKEMIASDPAGAKARLDEIKTMIDKWQDTLKEMAAAAPAKPEPVPKGKK